MKSLVVILISLLTCNVFAAQSNSTKVDGQYASIRALGMGNAFTAVADDYSLIMYNPAGFAHKKHNEFQLTLLGAGVSSKTLSIVDDIDKASKTTGTDSDKANAISAVLEKYYGQSLGGKLQALEMFWIRQGWGVALLPMNMTVDMSINKQVGPALDLNVKGDASVAFGFGKEINKYVDAGVTVKYIHRVSVEEIVPAFELATNSNVLSDKRFKEGTKADFDVGFLWKPNWFNKGNVESSSEPEKTESAVAPDDSKTDDSKVDEDKTDDKSVEEERQPQSEGDAKVAEDSKASDAKTDEAAKPGDGAAAATADVKMTPKDEQKTDEVKKTDEKSSEDTEEADASESEERFPLTFGFVVHNVIGGEFNLAKDINKNATDVPSKLYRVIDLGSQYLLRDGEDFKIRAMLDFQNLLHPEITFNKSLHAGLEFDYSPSTWFKTQFRAGVNQMYFTAGATFLLGIINIDVATYGEEVGTAQTKLENRVLAAKVGFNF